MDSYDNDWLFMLDDDLFIVWNKGERDDGMDKMEPESSEK